MTASTTPTASTCDLNELAPEVLASRDSLLEALAAIDREGWDGELGTALLQQVRRDVVQPIVRRQRLHGAVADHAEATGWSAAWSVLRREGFREVESPIGTLWVAVRRAVLGEQVSAAFGTRPRIAWGLAAGYWDAGERAAPSADPDGRPRPMASLTVLADRGWEPSTDDHAGEDGGSDLLDELAAVLSSVGWPAALARRVVTQVAVTAPANAGARSEAFGWRHLAVEVGIPPWQARRVTILLLGAPGWPGLVERLVCHGVAAVDEPSVRGMLRASIDPRAKLTYGGRSVPATVSA